MLETSLGIDTSTFQGWRDLAIIVLPICLIFGFLADLTLSDRGFGVLGNGFLAVAGMYLAIKLIDRFLAPSYAVNLTATLIFTAAAGGLFLALMTTLKRRLS